MKKRILIASTALLLCAGGFLAVVPIQTSHATNYTVHWYKKGTVDFYFAQKFTASCQPPDPGSYVYQGVVVRTSPGLTCMTP